MSGPMTTLQLPQPGERWRSPNGHEVEVGRVLGNCVMLPDIGWVNRKMLALSWTRVESSLPESVSDEEERHL